MAITLELAKRNCKPALVVHERFVERREVPLLSIPADRLLYLHHHEHASRAERRSITDE
jgi:hypothetical protein